MGDILRPILQVAAVAVNFIPGIGQLASLAITAGLTAAASALPAGRPRSTLQPFDPRSVNADPAAFRKALLGRGLFPLDLRYAEPSADAKQEYIEYIIVLAAHRSHSVDEFWIGDQLAWTPAGGAQGIFAGYLWVEVILEAGPSACHTVHAGTKWGPARQTYLTGCTTMKVRIKRSDNSKNSQSPFQGGLGGPLAVIGCGMPVYDPARDSTVPGGSGPQRANDCSTWAWTVGSVERGRNPALQALAVALGWRINGVVSVGGGMPPARLDLAGIAQAAARCDEAVALAAGGSHRRYEAGAVFTDGDDPLAWLARHCDAMNAELVDDGARLGIRVAVGDLTPALTLTDDDFVGGYNWRPQPVVDQQYTVVRGRFTLPSGTALFGPADYPEVPIPRASAAPRPLTLELLPVQDIRRAERIAKQVAQRNLIRGEFSVRVGVRSWLLRRNMVVAISFGPRGWVGKLFRVRGITSDFMTGEADVTFREESPLIYQWDAAETGSVTPVAPVPYDPRRAPSWLMAGIAPGADVTAEQPVVSKLSPATGAATAAFGAVDGNPFLRLVATGEARDGDVVSFPVTLSAVPEMVFLPGGNAAAANQNINISAAGLSASGFTQVAKAQAVTVGSTITDTGSSAGGVGEPTRVINRTNGGTPFDGRFVFTVDVVVGEVAPGEPGRAVIALFVKKGGNWTEVARPSFSATDSYAIATTPGSVDFGTGTEFGASLVSATGAGTGLSDLASVSYTLGTVTETSLTPAGASPIRWQAYLR